MNIFNKHARGERLYMLIVIFIILLTLVTLTNHINQQPHVRVASLIVQTEMAQSKPSVNEDEAATVITPVEISSQQQKLADVGLDYALVQTLLNDINFDEEDNLLLDTETRQQLDNAVALMGFERSAYELSQLNSAIDAYLPSAKARQVNDLLMSYFQYKVAEHDFLQARETNSIQDAENNYSALRALRQSYLGDGVAMQLFAQEDKYMEYTTAVMALDKDSSLSVNEREQRMAKLQLAYPLMETALEPQ